MKVVEYEGNFTGYRLWSDEIIGGFILAILGVAPAEIKEQWVQSDRRSTRGVVLSGDSRWLRLK